MPENAAKIKICGLFRPEDIDAANGARPDYIGFVFAESRRRVTPEAAEKLRARLAEGIVPVGVFADQAAEGVAALYRAGTISLAQLHGAETPEYAAGLKRECPGLMVIKTVSVRGASAGELAANASRAAENADFLLFDGAAAGSGRVFAWDPLRAWARNAAIPWFLAGGIGAANIDEALALGPYCIDISSGAETDGRKDRQKIIALVQKVRGHGGEPAGSPQRSGS